MEDTTEIKTPKKPSNRKAVVFIILGMLAVLLLGGAAGYGEGVRERVSAQSTKVAGQLGEQMGLIEQDIADGRYDNARQRLEYIIKENPNFPGAAEKLAFVLVQAAITPSPVPSATPTITPTPDKRDQEAVFASAKEQLAAKDWNSLINSLDTLRKKDPTFNAATIDAWYYTALRNRGLDQILGTNADGISNLEGGIYDLTLAERFGPLDGYAAGLREFSRAFITAASYWDINWAAAVENFRLVAQNTPNLRDSSNVTALERFYQSLLGYGDELAAAGDSKTHCSALDVWNEAKNLYELDGEYQQKYKVLKEECNPPTKEPEMPTDVPVDQPTETPLQ